MTGYTDPGQHLFWLASRAVGVVALLLVALSVGLGLALAGRVGRDPAVTAKIRALHEATALTALIAILAHGMLLIGDSYLRPGLQGVLIPFVIAHKPLWTGVGIIGGWLAAILGLSFYFRKQIGTKTWRWMHRWTLGVYVLAVIHTLGAGTDARAAWLLALVVATAVPIVLLITVRYFPRPKEKPLAPARGGARLTASP